MEGGREGGREGGKDRVANRQINRQEKGDKELLQTVTSDKLPFAHLNAKHQ